MRQIKFRGKSIYNSKWVYGCVTIHGERAYISATDCGAHSEVSLSTIGQFTGLTDCNGKEIYEGDIVRYIDANDTIRESVVEYKDSAFSPITEICWMTDIQEQKCEVIGNIYDTPIY